MYLFPTKIAPANIKPRVNRILILHSHIQLGENFFAFSELFTEGRVDAKHTFENSEPGRMLIQIRNR